MKIEFNNLRSQCEAIKLPAQKRIDDLFSECCFINGKDVELFETNFSIWNGNKYAVGVSSGTDAIYIALSSLNLRGNIQVYTSSNTFIATVFAAEMAFGEGCEIHLIDHDEFFLMDVNKLEHSLSKHHKKGANIIIPVHLYGQACDMKKIIKITAPEIVWAPVKFSGKVVADEYMNAYKIPPVQQAA